MGEDKAHLRLGGRTLVEIAAGKLRPCCDEVVVVSGERDLGPVGDRAIRDLHPGCGPIGGMEAALRDVCERGPSEWAMFVPVDMPLVPAGLLGWVLDRWIEDTETSRVCLAKAGGRVQPLLSLLHAEIEPYLGRAILAGNYKVAPVLFEAADDLARARGLAGEAVLRIEPIETMTAADAGSDWTPTAEEQRLWFQNVNTPAEFQDIKQMLRERGAPDGSL